jgi:hypothetical protein
MKLLKLIIFLTILLLLPYSIKLTGKNTSNKNKPPQLTATERIAD